MKFDALIFFFSGVFLLEILCILLTVAFGIFIIELSIAFGPHFLSVDMSNYLFILFSNSSQMFL